MPEDLYSGYDDASSPLSPAAPPIQLQLPVAQVGRMASARASSGRVSTAGRLRSALARGPLTGAPSTSRKPGTGMQTSGATVDEAARPMTAVKAAGYVSTMTTQQDKRQDNMRGSSSAEQCKKMETEVHELMEEAAVLIHTGHVSTGHGKAQQALKKADQLQKLMDDHGWHDNAISDLHFAVQMSAAHCAHANGLHQESSETYKKLLNNSDFHMPSRLRVAIGNMYATRNHWSEAIKQYRMALDQIPTNRQGHDANPFASLQSHILHNISVAFLQQGLVADARDNFDLVVKIMPTMISAFNRLVSTYMTATAPERTALLREAFVDLLTVPEVEGLIARQKSAQSPPAPTDVQEMGDLEQLSQTLLTAAKLVSPCLDDSSNNSGFQWCTSELQRAGLLDEARKVMLANAAYLLSRGYTERAIDVFKQCEQHSGAARLNAATNLAFLYQLEGKFEEAEQYATLATQEDPWHVQALVNLGNCKFQRAMETDDAAVREDLISEARSAYDTAAERQPDCFEAVFNVGLAAKECQQYDLAMEQFVMLNGMLPNQPEVLYHIADLYDLKGDRKRSVKMFNLVYDFVGSEPGILTRLGGMYTQAGKRADAMRMYQDSFAQLPAIDVLSILCTQQLNEERYDTAAKLYGLAAKMQPSEAQWHLMVAGCHRSAHHYEKALTGYEKVHRLFPECKEALICLIEVSKRLQDQSKVEHYEINLQKLERLLATREGLPRPVQKGRTSAPHRPSGISPRNSLTTSDYRCKDTKELAQRIGLLPEMGEHMKSEVYNQTAPISKNDPWHDEVLGADLLPGLD